MLQHKRLYLLNKATGESDVKKLFSSKELKNEVVIEKPPNLNPAYVTLGVLLLACISNQWCRQSIYYLCDFSKDADTFRHINADLSFSQEAYASLSSIVFTGFFATFSIIAGSKADKYPRNLIILGSCAVWSLATGLQSVSNSFLSFAVLRAIVGASQAFFNPAAYTIIADIFPKTLIAQANGLITCGIYLGGAFASLSIILDSNIGWRNTLLVIGGIGILAFAATAIFVEEPRGKKIEYKGESNVTSKQDLVVSTSSASSSEVGDTWAKVFTSLKDVWRPTEAQLLFTVILIRSAPIIHILHVHTSHLTPILSVDRLLPYDMRRDFR
jgi:MFS family permease